MKFGDKIRALREDRKMTMQDVADKLGVQKAAIHKYEHGLVSPKLSVVEQLAKIFEQTKQTDFRRVCLMPVITVQIR